MPSTTRGCVEECERTLSSLEAEAECSSGSSISAMRIATGFFELKERVEDSLSLPKEAVLKERP